MTDHTYRCGWVALMGPPNAGKSTLLNALLGQKVTIVTPKPQTTRNQIVGILTDEEAQVIFMDTPGLTQVRGRLSKTMIQAVWQSLGQADVIMPILDSHLYIRHPEFLDRDLAPVAEALASDERPMIVVVNKVDLFSDKSRMLPLLTRLNEMWPRADIFPTSALRRDGLPELKALIRSKLPEGPAQFPEDQISTASLRFMAAEIIREKLFLHLRQEVPYAVAVDVERWEEDAERGQTTDAHFKDMTEMSRQPRDNKLKRELDFILDIPLDVSAELGRTRLLINELLQLGQGSVVELNKLAGEPLEVYVNGKLVARGEAVVINEKFGVRLTDIISPIERVKQLG